MLRRRDSILKRETSIEMRRRRYMRGMDGVGDERHDGGHGVWNHDTREARVRTEDVWLMVVFISLFSQGSHEYIKNP